jgi:hypothetical protein
MLLVGGGIRAMISHGLKDSTTGQGAMKAAALRPGVVPFMFVRLGQRSRDCLLPIHKARMVHVNIEL